uniref:Neur_chan_LBD domain-containing protein n=1 Tax=Meloidogyne hapla TaxID=6305 RepID=A0A1I8BR56_MELHA
MDSARCQLVFESYSYNTATVTIDWMPSALTLLFDEISASDHQLVHTKLFKHTEYYKAGEWYRLTLEMGFRRRYGYYLLQVYANTYINVFLSWIAFCISLKALSARVILSVNTLISLCVQDKKMLRRSIRFSVGVGSLFDLACLNKALAETAADFGGNIGAISGVRRKPSQHVDNGDDYGENGSSGSSGRQSESLLDEIVRRDSLPNMPKKMARRILRKQQNKYLSRGHKVDQWSFFLFPLAFSLFNVLYWAYYLGRRRNE